MASITAANAVLVLSQATLFPAPVQMQGFDVDDVYDIDGIKSVEVKMGVDGILSAGFVFAEVIQRITLQADSASNLFFDTIWLQMQSAEDAYPLDGVITLPGVATKFTQTRGFLTNYPPAPAGKRVLQPRRFELTWQKIAPAPTGV